MESLHESVNESLDERYFYCPNCGEKDLEFFDEVLIKKISRKQLKYLSEEQKLYVNEKLEYGVFLCEHCYNKTKRISWIIRGLYLIAFVLLYIIPLASICLIPVIWYITKYELTRDFDFEHAWKCNAVRRVKCK